MENNNMKKLSYSEDSETENISILFDFQAIFLFNIFFVC